MDTTLTATPAIGQPFVTGLLPSPPPLSRLLGELDEAPVAAGSPASVTPDRLAHNRLGVASSLFTALRTKHPPSAYHSLRVALLCSSWSQAVDLPAEDRDALEIAALLHDVGKIGVPDQVLLKPAALAADEAAIMDRHRQYGLEILSACCASEQVLQIVTHAGTPYGGRRQGDHPQGEDLPRGARMLAIVDAYDAMTTDHVYRRAMSRERAVAELFQHAPAQFDPRLVQQFAALDPGRIVEVHSRVAHRWASVLSPDLAQAHWCAARPLARGAEPLSAEAIFLERLLENMHDGVVFISQTGQILHWNRGAERLTGIPAGALVRKQWSPDLVEMRDADGNRLREDDCPVAGALLTSTQALQRLLIRGRGGKAVTVDAHIFPVVTQDGAQGATLLLRDASSEKTLEEEVQTLHEKATKDPLTQLANRAEFDRVHRAFAKAHLERGVTCSLIICDLDRFKQINDVYGHQAGDEALKSFASLLRNSCRQGDLVARYGGEEFVMLCADCDNAAATLRAERVRTDLSQLPQPVLGGRSITSSFGVTEIQAGDTPETMLRRADRALLQAKDNGRNRVVQLGSGLNELPLTSQRSWWRGWLRDKTPETLLVCDLLASVPLRVAAEKLRGFVADHFAEIISIEGNHLVLGLEEHSTAFFRRRSDRPVPAVVELDMSEVYLDGCEGRPQGGVRTLIHVRIRPKRSRDRRRDVDQRARQLLASLKSYLIAQEISPSGDGHPAAAKAAHDPAPATPVPSHA